ncbi:MAG: NADH-quinone oxidoreductase subunit I [Dehalococcoidia bacterium]
MVYGVGLSKALLTTLKHLGRPPVTLQFPEEKRDLPKRARTNLVWFVERCTGCSTCAQACPDGCILVETEPREDGSYLVNRYEIDFRLCMYCGLCVEACPYEAIEVGGSYTNVVTNPDDLYKNKEGLIAEANEYLDQHDWIYPNGQPAVRQEVHAPAQRQHH